MFTQCVYMKKPSNDIIKSLLEMGYRFVHSQKTSTQEPQEYLFVQLGKISYETRNWCRHVDFAKYCDKNHEQLFLALASLRDDSDKDQWFVADNPTVIEDYAKWFKCPYNDIKQIKYSAYINATFTYHKASVEELIEHFN